LFFLIRQLGDVGRDTLRLARVEDLSRVNGNYTVDDFERANTSSG
jgi:hypothetical protein